MKSYPGANVAVAGATGRLGGRIVRALRSRNASVRALVRQSSDPEAVKELRAAGAEIAVVNYEDAADLRNACVGTGCVVSALSGLYDVIVDAQGALLGAAVSAGVRRFIPSDYCIDFTKLPRGSNRNLDLRRNFHGRLDAAPIQATSVFNGAFADMLTGQAPIILFKFKRVLYWESAEQLMDFTTIDDTAEFTARAALDMSAPRYLRVAGDTLSARGLVVSASKATGDEFRLLRAGSLKRLGRVIRVTRAIVPAPDALYPPWQGMQYLHNMFGGLAKLEPLDNGRYPDIRFTRVREVLEAHVRAHAPAP